MSEEKKDFNLKILLGILIFLFVGIVLYSFNPNSIAYWDCKVNLKDHNTLYKGDKHVCWVRYSWDGVDAKGGGFYVAEAVLEADYDTFEFVLRRDYSIGGDDKYGDYYKDKNNVYKINPEGVEILEGVDPASFDENYFENE